jgi:hypothetical protein
MPLPLMRHRRDARMPTLRGGGDYRLTLVFGAGPGALQRCRGTLVCDFAGERRWTRALLKSWDRPRSNLTLPQACPTPLFEPCCLRPRKCENPAFAGLSCNSGGGIRTRDLRVMRSAGPGQEGSDSALLSGSSPIACPQFRSDGPKSGPVAKARSTRAGTPCQIRRVVAVDLCGQPELRRWTTTDLNNPCRPNRGRFAGPL